ncbi:MAG: carboxymuconolactone decarboxylase family protein [Alphaproteobacteria bacterium]|nr:carboxymuconolactone decarboxylase family protein [Alphaproteobacteria bacterium]
MTASPATQPPARLPVPTRETLSPAQQQVWDAIASGPRGGVRGPFLALLHSPELANRVQHLGEYLRYGSTLPPRLSELAILVTARAWTCQYEWFAHEPHALKAGLPQRVIDSIKDGQRPDFAAEDELALYDFAAQMHRDRRVDDATYARAAHAFGPQGVVDLVGILGYYTLIAMTLNGHQIPLPAGATAPLAAR